MYVEDKRHNLKMIIVSIDCAEGPGQACVVKSLQMSEKTDKCGFSTKN